MVMSSPAVLILALLSTLGEEFNMNRVDVAAFQPDFSPLCRQSADTRAASRTCGIGWSSRRAPTAACRTTSSSSSLPTTTFLGNVLFWAPPSAPLALFSESNAFLAPFLSTQKLCFKSHIDLENWMAFQGHCGEMFLLQSDKIKLCWHLIKMWGIRQYQQYRFGATGWCYTTNWAPKQVVLHIMEKILFLLLGCDGFSS